MICSIVLLARRHRQARLVRLVCWGVVAVVAGAWGPPVAEGAPGIASSGYVAAQTRQVVGKRTTVTRAELWFTPTRYRLETRPEKGRPTILVYDGRAAYRWTEGARFGRVWHPTGVSVLRDVVRPLLQSAPLSDRRRVGSGRVVGIPCTLYEGNRHASATPGAWWQGMLRARVWQSADPRFPYPLRTVGSDASGNRVECEVTALRLNVVVPESYFRPSTYTRFLPPPDVRRGQALVGAPLPVGPVALHLADLAPRNRPAGGRRVVMFGRQRFVLDPRPLAGTRDVEEARLEPCPGASGKVGEAIVLYLSLPASARVARTCARAQGRYLVVLVGGSPAAASRIVRPWAEEDRRVVITASDVKRLRAIADRLQSRVRALTKSR